MIASVPSGRTEYLKAQNPGHRLGWNPQRRWRDEGGPTVSTIFVANLRLRTLDRVGFVEFHVFAAMQLMPIENVDVHAALASDRN
jgi:hypothetical protein